MLPGSDCIESGTAAGHDAADGAAYPIRAGKAPGPVEALSAFIAAEAALLARAADLAAVVEAMLDACLRIPVGKPFLLLSEVGGGLRLAGHRGLAPAVRQDLEALAEDGDSLPARALRASRSTAAGAPMGPIVLDGPLRAATLRVSGRTLGVLGWTGAEPAAPAALVLLSGIFSASLARALKGARTQRRTQARDAVRRAALAVSGNREFRSILQGVADRVRLLTGAAEAAVRRVDPAGGEELWITSRDPGRAPSPVDVHRVDIRHLGRMVGEIRLARGKEGGRPTEADLHTASLLAEHVAATLDNAGAYELLVREVEERRMAETALRLTERRLRDAIEEHEVLFHQIEADRRWLQAVIECSPVGILLVEDEGDGFKVTANQAAQELCGAGLPWGSPPLAGLLVGEGGTPVPLGELPTVRARAGEQIQLEEARLFRADGEPLPVILSAGPIRDAAGTVRGAVVTLQDNSASKGLERLRQQWISLISHDLRQPITSISGFAELIAGNAELPTSLRPKVNHIREAARRLARLATDLFDASRLEANQLVLERQRVDLRSLVLRLVDELATELGPHPVRVAASEELPHIDADPVRLEQVMGNLLANAGKYGLADTPIDVAIEALPGELCVRVTNQTDGLGPDDASRLFERYYRTERARRSRVRGLGLGLYLTRGIVEAHGGRIWAESSPGRDLTIALSLPR